MDLSVSGAFNLHPYFDVTCLLITACMTFFALGHIMGLGIGTVVAAFTMGKGIAIIGNWMDQHVEFISVLQPATVSVDHHA